MSKQNILILKFPYSSLFGGGERHTLTLVEGLRKKGFSFFLASSCPVLLKEFKERNWHSKKMWAPKEPVSKKSLLLFPFFAPFFFCRLAFLLLSFRFRNKVKIVFCLSLTEKILITVPARMLGMKVVWMEHVSANRWLTLNPLRVFYTMYAMLAMIVVVSESIKSELIGKLHIQPKNIVTIYSGTDLPEVTLKDIKARVNKGEFIIGTIARLEREKGIEYLIRAIDIVKDIIPKIKLIVVGDGSERRNLNWLVNSLQMTERVQFVGFQDHINQWIRNFDVFVLPSAIRESFGMVLIDAMANLRPVVASKIGGIAEIVDHKETGILVEPKNSEEIANAIIYLYNHPEETVEIIKNARAKIETSFTKQKMLNEFEKLFIVLSR
ncbi:glycosyltransferase family 4 protein [Patescibacteria group bacterium]|nr:glycosyltransferase family 4 protein [Patescibacteria group bacterium]